VTRDVATLFAPGELLAGRFRIVRESARGGMGVVYEARDEKLDRRIAIKAAQSGHAWLLSPEVRNASTVSHPNICRIYELHSAHTAAGDVDFITMEYLEGETLAERIARGTLTDAEARAIGLQLCAGLAEAHRNHVIHGDLKPQNILLSRAADGAVRAVIMDFGLAQGPRERGSSGGTPGYMAPELVAGGATSVASDLYALGVILHELVSGLRPRERAAELAPTITALADTPPAPAGSGGDAERWSQPQPLPLGRRWDPILRRCLAPDPTARFRDVAELQRALDPPRGRGAVVLVALALVAAAVGFAAWRVNAPATTVKLAVRSTIAVDDALAQLRGTRARGYRVVRDANRATHLLSVDGGGSGDSAVVVVLTRPRTHETLARWTGVYAKDELAYAPAAVAGVVSATLHLTPAPSRFRSPEARALYERALPLLRQDDQLDSARALMRRAAALEPSSPLPWAGAAEAEWRHYYLESTDDWLAHARESVRRAERRGMDAPEVHSIAGQLETKDGRFAQAIARLERATELPNASSDPWRRLGDAYRLNDQPDLALHALRKAVEVEPGFYRTHQNLGSWFFNRGDYRAAIPELQTAVRLAPTMARLRSVLASALMNVGRFEDAERELRTALAQREDATVLHSLGQVLMYQSRDREAVPCFRRAAELDSTQFLSRLYLGDCLRATGDAAEARAAYARSFTLAERKVREAPQSGYYRAFLAYLCARRGDAGRAEAEIAQALRSSPEEADVLWEAALTYESLGRRDEAVAILERMPRGVLEDLSRWPAAAALMKDARAQQALHATPRTP
jgi:eukaryotic-like serine/threonine-protein kinase